MRTRWSRTLACGLLLWQAGGALCADAPPSALERLEQARQLLTEQALRASTRVDALTWVDAQGRVQEHQSMRQSVQWPALQGSAAGQAPRDWVLEAHRSGNALASTTASAPPAPAASCPARTGSTLHPALALRTHWPARLSPGVRTRLQDTLGLQWLASDSTAPRPWRMFRLPQRPEGLSPYTQLLSSPPQPNSPWTVELRLDLLPSGDSEVAHLAWHLSLWQRNTLLGEQRATLQLPQRQPPWGAPEWTDPAWATVQQQLRDWGQWLDQRLACVRPQPEVVAQEADHWVLNMGSLAGLRLGDEWALVDPASLPERTLEAGAIEQMVVARVVRLTPLRAELSLVAGQAQAPRNGWVAHPFSDVQPRHTALTAPAPIHR